MAQFVAFQRYTQEHPLGCELIVNFDLITKIEVQFYTSPDPQNNSNRLSVKDGRADMTAQKWFVVYTAGERVTVRRQHGKVYDLVEQIVKNALKTD